MGKMGELETLQAIWYQKLKDEGFRDIESPKAHSSTGERPLLVWESFYFAHPALQPRRILSSEYLEKGERFLNDESLQEIASLVVSHFNCPLSSQEAITILELHISGKNERSIATQMKRSKTCIHQTLTRFRTWMDLVSIPEREEEELACG